MKPANIPCHLTTYREDLGEALGAGGVPFRKDLSLYVFTNRQADKFIDLYWSMALGIKKDGRILFTVGLAREDAKKLALYLAEGLMEDPE